MKSKVITIIITATILICGCGSTEQPLLLNIEQYPYAEAPSEAPILRWDFSGYDQYRYLIEIDTSSVTNIDAGDLSDDNTQTSTTEGNMVIKSQGDHTARIVLEKMEVTTDFSPDDGNDSDTSNMTGYTIVIQDMQEDGTLGSCNTSEEALVKLILPLPSTPLELGESVDVPVQVPFYAMGSLLPVKGQITITLQGYVSVNGQLCARLIGDIDISEMDIPEEIEGDYECIITGVSDYLFAVDSKKFILGEVAIVMKIEGDFAPVDVDPASEGFNIPDRVKIGMEIEEYLKIQLSN